ncbi:MAG: Exodeoxyribonuclease III [Fimbriimonadaceae bacterium]|nr:Exodeoxyribonuclease III [Fimbriimonadaceae bacterium]
MKIATYNVNSIRQRLPIVLDWIAVNDPDVMALQETKVTDDLFPREPFEELGLHLSVHGQKSYNGIAIISKHPIIAPQTGFCDPSMPEDCRVQKAEIAGVTVLNTYVPNGTKVGTDKFAYKLQWLERFRRYCDTQLGKDEPVIWLGDINIARQSIDVYNPSRFLGTVGHHPDEFLALDRVVDWGWTDCFREFTKEGGHFSFWDFLLPNGFERNLGWRIDLIYASPALASKCTSCTIDKGPRGEAKPSDHTTVVAEFDV